MKITGLLNKNSQHLFILFFQNISVFLYDPDLNNNLGILLAVLCQTLVLQRFRLNYDRFRLHNIVK
jgi:hypothetical protein